MNQSDAVGWAPAPEGARRIDSAKSQERLSEAGLTYDAGKPRVELIPTDVLMEIGRAFGDFAGAKYEDRNWEKGMSWSRRFASLLRHAYKWWAGEDYDIDKETGVKTLHITLVVVNAMMLCAYVLRKRGKDDRGTV